MTNQTADSVEVWCRPGFDGGHAQQFQFEIFDTHSAVLLYNKSGRYPHLRVGNLESGLKLFIQVSAFNLRGRSALVPLEAYTVKIADKQTGNLSFLSAYSKCDWQVVEGNLPLIRVWLINDIVDPTVASSCDSSAPTATAVSWEIVLLQFY